MIYGRSKGGNKLDTISFSLMFNPESMFGTYIFEESKGRHEWEKAMEAENETLIKNRAW